MIERKYIAKPQAGSVTSDAQHIFEGDRMNNLVAQFTITDTGERFAFEGPLSEGDVRALKERLCEYGIKALTEIRTPLAGDEDDFIIGFLKMNPSRHECFWKETRITLTATEFKIVYALAHRHGRIKSRDSLITDAYGPSIHVDDRTIDSHIKRIRFKFKHADPAWNEIETLYGIGYRYRDIGRT